MTLDELIREYSRLAEEYRRKKAAAQAELSAYIASLLEEETFAARFQERLLVLCGKRHDEAALRAANDGIQPGKDFLEETRQSARYRSELNRLIFKDSEYIFAQRALKRPEEFLQPRGIRLLGKLLRGEEKKTLEALAQPVETDLGTDFVMEYCAAADLSSCRHALFRAVESTVEQALRAGGLITLDMVRAMIFRTFEDEERELLCYRALGIRAFRELPELMAETAYPLLPRHEEAAAIAAEFGVEQDILAQLEAETEYLELDSELSARLLSVFTVERILVLARQDPLIGKAAAAEIDKWETTARRKQELRYNIVTAMPERYQDLYPATRRMRRRFVLHAGPTNSGKTYAGMQALMQCANGVYLSPLRLLALEKAEELNAAGYPCSLITGEEERLVDGALFTSSTVEMADFTEHYECAVIDECQLMTDPVRGGGWTAAVLGLQADVIHACLSPWAVDILIGLVEACGDDYDIVMHERACTLTAGPRPAAFPNGIHEHDALIAFSRRSVHAIAAELDKAGKKCSIIYGNLPYDVRQHEAEKFRTGETNIVVATDAIGMGLNLPIRRVVFMETEKYDGKEVRPLEDEEIRQIAGRAGRRGIFEQGFATAEASWFVRRIDKAIHAFHSEHQTPMFGFPKQLLGIDSPVSVLMAEWEELPPAPGFEKADLSEPKLLAEQAEKLTDDRQTVYRLAMIPFDTKNESCLALWQELAETLVRGSLKELRIPEPPTGAPLLELEQQSSLCDIYFQFGRQFGVPSLKAEAMERKDEISRRIMRQLDRQGKQQRRCAQCGSVLPWNYRYRLCEECHARDYRRRR